MDLGLSGLASGFDWRSLVDQLIEVERAPEQRMRSEQSTIQQRNSAYTSMQTQLLVLQNRVKDLSDPKLFESRAATSSDADVAKAEVTAGAPQGNYVFNFIQLAQTARQVGSSDVGNTLNPTNDVSGLALSSAGFSTAVTAGTLTVNGKQISIATSDTLKSVFDKIQTATGGTVTGSYDAGTDKISFTGSGPIVLGSAADTSNFFEVAKLYNNGTGTVTSTSALGGVNLGGSLASANLRTTVTDGGAGAGEFKINGVSISFNASTDSVRTVLDRINSSAAGVNASYDALKDRFVLTNKTGGDTGIALEDVTGNFLAATGVSGGLLERGKDLLYTVNGGDQLVSRSNTITEASSGIPGLSVTALAENTATISVASDTAAIKSKITDFIADYNKAQAMVETNTASSTDAKGIVTAGLLAGDPDAYNIASKLRSLANTTLSSLTGSLKTLADLGINSNGNDNNLALDDETKLTNALTSNLDQVKALFTDATSGLAVQLNDYLESTAGDEGTMAAKMDNMSKESARIDTQISDYERQVQAERQRLINSFVAMESAQANINQQLQYLTKQFGS